MKNIIAVTRSLILIAGLFIGSSVPAIAQLPAWLPPHVDANGQTLDPIVYPHPSAYFTGVTSLVFTPDGSEVAVGAGTSISMINVKSGLPRLVWTAHKGLVTSLAFASDGALVSTASDGTMTYWDVMTGNVQRTAPPLKAFVAFSPDGKLWAESDSGRGEVRVKDIATGKKVHGVKVEKSPGGYMAMTINRRELAFIQGGYSVGASALAFSVDGKILATAGSSVKLWDLATGKEVATLRGNSDSIAAVAFSRDGRLLASGGLDHAVKIFEVTGGKELRTLAGHQNVVNAVSFSPDGGLIATGSWDNTIKFWEAESGREILTVNLKWLWEVVKAQLMECIATTPSAGQPGEDECKVLVTVRHYGKSPAWMPSKHYKIFLFLPPGKHMQVEDIGWKGEREMVKAGSVTYAGVASGEEAEFLMKFYLPKDVDKKELKLVLLDAAPVPVTAPAPE